MPTEDWKLFRSPSAVTCLQQMSVLLGNAQRSQLGSSEVWNENMLAKWCVSCNESLAGVVVLLDLRYKLCGITINSRPAVVRLVIVELLECKLVKEKRI